MGYYLSLFLSDYATFSCIVSEKVFPFPLLSLTGFPNRFPLRLSIGKGYTPFFLDGIDLFYAFLKKGLPFSTAVSYWISLPKFSKVQHWERVWKYLIPSWLCNILLHSLWKRFSLFHCCLLPDLFTEVL